MGLEFCDSVLNYVFRTEVEEDIWSDFDDLMRSPTGSCSASEHEYEREKRKGRGRDREEEEEFTPKGLDDLIDSDGEDEPTPKKKKKKRRKRKTEPTKTHDTDTPVKRKRGRCAFLDTPSDSFIVKNRALF